MSLLNKKINKKYNRKYSKKNKYHMSGGMKIFISYFNNKITQEVNPEATVDSIRSLVANHMGIESDYVRLVCKGKNLENGYTLHDYRIEQENTISAYLKLGYCSEDKRRELENIKNETDDMRSKREALYALCQDVKPTATFEDYGKKKKSDDKWLKRDDNIAQRLRLGAQVFRLPSDDPWADWERSKVSVLNHKSEAEAHADEIAVLKQEILSLKQENLSLKQLLRQQTHKTDEAEPYD
jgi:hypothetical protein